MFAENYPPYSAGDCKTLETLAIRLEQIRQAQLSKNCFRLRTLSAEQQRSVELLSLRIMQTVLSELTERWQAAAGEAAESSVAEIVSNIWELTRSPSRGTK